tara:strand:+ start:280 stop:1200 length:921 start_codon:yes stop_codon:yes gene_type:complete
MTGWIVPGAPADSTSINPQQQKAFSSWWLDQQYGGDLNNVAGLTQNENGYWQGEPGRKYDINPETGQRGVYQFLSGSGAPGWLDVTPEKYGEYSNIGGGQVKMIRNRHGLYTPESAYGHDGNFSRQYQFTTNPNTGEEGKWIFLGQMGWVNIEGDPQPEPADGTITFGAGGQIAGPYNSERDNPNGDQYTDNNQTSTTPPPATTAPPADPTADPTAGSTPPVVPRTGMLNPEQNSWLQVLNRQGASLDSWDSYLGMFTNRQNNIDWSQLDSNQVQSSFESLASEGLFPTLQQGAIYSDLMKRLGYV